MSLILNIDTAVQTASICLSEKDTILGLVVNPSQKDHAAWLQVAIKVLLEEKHIDLRQLEAIAVSSGPGSYTGLRVAMASAKGLCYALKIPLITINTLKIMANSAKAEPTDLLCPMIDARRMEVFAALFNHSLEKDLISSTNMILDANSFEKWLNKQTITFFGSGSAKFHNVMHHPNAFFKEIETTAEHMPELSSQRLKNQEFANPAYAEPFYGKEFYSTLKHS